MSADNASVFHVDGARTAPTDWTSGAMQKRIAKRYAAERRFKYLGLAAVVLSASFLAFLLYVMVGNGLSGFQRTEAQLTIDFPALTGGTSAAAISGPTAETVIASLDLPGVVGVALEAEYGTDGKTIFSSGAWQVVQQKLLADPSLIEQKQTMWLPASSDIDIAAKEGGTGEARALLGQLRQKDVVRTSFNSSFLTGSDATDPAQAGIWSAFKGSLMTMLITVVLAFPIGVFAALYLEEYAPKNRWTDLIEVSINNLAAVPSIIFGLLGLVVFLNWFAMPRSAAIVGGLTLALMTMPIIVIAGRNAIKSVPPSIREAALGIGASPVQVVFHHVLPLALPGILTGTIIGMARALGETAPLLLIGMRAFIPTAPGGFTDPATVLPVQIFLWSDEINRGFVEKTSAAIIVLLLFLLSMNAVAIYLRNKFETRW
ncbi:phosphate ABC transporter permease PstA [Novosphingopyxis sp.]|uniref:phosphate ABC transporter permease PstA n=1 Tax=Novosphingopyxis sp. TaxID=2709690 RepID=UPI003B591F5A